VKEEAIKKIVKDLAFGMNLENMKTGALKML
jgi:hypothetical protein